jgi:predicted dehydrogenase
MDVGVQEAFGRAFMVNVGIIGLGAAWDSRYRPALASLAHRIRVCAVYDTVAYRAEQVALEFSAVPFEGVRALVNHSEVRGILFLDGGWHAAESLAFLCSSRKPAFVAGSMGSDAARVARFRARSTAEGATIMPEFSRRYTPATSRLQELMATRLGNPQRLVIDAMLPDSESSEFLPGQKTTIDYLVGLFDWCRYVLRTAPVALHSRPLDANGAGDRPGRTITVEFAKRRSGGESPTAELRLHAPQAAKQPKTTGFANSPTYEIHCEHGRAVIGKSDAIEWEADCGQMQESLTSDRSEFEVMLDHFCRRVAGGLIPVADIVDVCQCLHLAYAAEQSLAQGSTIDCSGLA